MARRIIHIEPTDEQWATINYIYAGHTPFLAQITDSNGEPNGSLYAELIVDDHTVRLYTIAPDGELTYEELEGLNQGWTKYDEDGNEVEREEGDDDE